MKTMQILVIPASAEAAALRFANSPINFDLSSEDGSWSSLTNTENCQQEQQSCRKRQRLDHLSEEEKQHRR